MGAGERAVWTCMGKEDGPMQRGDRWERTKIAAPDILMAGVGRGVK